MKPECATKKETVYSFALFFTVIIDTAVKCDFNQTEKD